MELKYLLLSGPIMFFLTVSILERITPNYDPTVNYISELSLMKYCSIQRINFFVSGLLTIALCLFLASMSSSPLAKVGWVAGALVGVSFASAGVWNTDVNQATRTTAGVIHEWGYWIGVWGAALVCVLVAIANRSNRFILVYSLIEALFAGYMIIHGGHWIKSGIYQRLLLYSLLIWIEIVATWTMFRS